jgi:hypothetical protein
MVHSNIHNVLKVCLGHGIINPARPICTDDGRFQTSHAAGNHAWKSNIFTGAYEYCTYSHAALVLATGIEIEGFVR